MTGDICNRDCLHCRYDDCILPDDAPVTDKELALSRRLDKIVNPSITLLPAERHARRLERAKEYRHENAAEISVKRHAQYMRDHDRVIAQQRQYRDENREKIRLYCHDYYYAHHDKMLENQRAYRARKRAKKLQQEAKNHA